MHKENIEWLKSGKNEVGYQACVFPMCLFRVYHFVYEDSDMAKWYHLSDKVKQFSIIRPRKEVQNKITKRKFQMVFQIFPLYFPWYLQMEFAGEHIAYYPFS